MQSKDAYTALAIAAMAGALVSGILPDPWGTVLPLVFVGALILALYLRFQTQTRAGGNPLPRSSLRDGPPAVVAGANDPSHSADPARGTAGATQSAGDREV